MWIHIRLEIRMTTPAKFSMSGCSQSIRLPVKLRLDAKEVHVE